MQSITNFAEAQDALRPYYDNSRTPYTLDAMRSLMTFLGNPQETFKTLHVAGTSGKTSTAYYCAALLKASGHNVGLTVSPHVDTVNERVQINGAPMPEADFCAALTAFLELIKTAPVQPSYFELMVALAYWQFARQNVEYAVIEVGLGGLLDGTNVIHRPDKICIITDIGLDHTEILGDTIEKIAKQKAGIIQPGNTVFMCTQDASVITIVQAASDDKQATLNVLPKASAIPINDLPAFQQRNLGLATAAVNFAVERDFQELVSDAIIETAAKTIIPARLERRTVNNKTIIIDGSHNQQKLTTLIESIDQLYTTQQATVLCSFVAGNQDRWQDGLRVLLRRNLPIIFTTFKSEQDIPKASITAQQFAEFCTAENYTNYTMHEDPIEAYQQLISDTATLGIVTGSFYLLNHIRPLLKETT
jgi:dihydrofolate synthase/folylpolyglutamate synthase